MEALRYLFLMFKRFSALTEFELVLFHVISHACKTLLASPILNDIAELPQIFKKNGHIASCLEKLLWRMSSLITVIVIVIVAAAG